MRTSVPSFTLLSLLFLIVVAHQEAPAAAQARPVPDAGLQRPPDPTESDGDKYRVVLENEYVRVLRYHDEPGAKTHLHHHPNAFVMYALTPFRRKLTFPNGKTVERVFGKDEAQWVPAQSHLGENLGADPTEGLLIEVKSCVPR